MFRLDILDRNGAALEPLAPPFCYHMSTARRTAIESAKSWNHDILIVRTGGESERPALLVHPDGTYSPPPGVQGACKRRDGDGPCFCPACRAGRKAKP